MGLNINYDGNNANMIHQMGGDAPLAAQKLVGDPLILEIVNSNISSVGELYSTFHKSLEEIYSAGKQCQDSALQDQLFHKMAQLIESHDSFYENDKSIAEHAKLIRTLPSLKQPEIDSLLTLKEEEIAKNRADPTARITQLCALAISDTIALPNPDAYLNEGGEDIMGLLR